MAKVIVEYDIRLGDRIWFKGIGGKKCFGVVQCISQLPDIFVETWEEGKHKRYCISINEVIEISGTNKLNGHIREIDEPYKWYHVEAENDEPLEFIYKKDKVTPKIIEKYHD